MRAFACRVRWLSTRLRSASTTRRPPAASSATIARARQSSARPLFDQLLFASIPTTSTKTTVTAIDITLALQRPTSRVSCSGRST